jgi:hypothetical protein
MNFNDHTVNWDTDTISFKDSDTSTLLLAEALIAVHLSANDPQTVRGEYSRAIKIIDAETSEKLQVEEQHQHKDITSKISSTFYGTLGELNMEPISLLIANQFMRVYTDFLDNRITIVTMQPNCKFIGHWSP